MKVRRSGDTLLLAEYEAVIDPVVNAKVVALAAGIAARGIAGVRDVVPGYCVVAVHFDPLRSDMPALERAVREEAARIESGPVEKPRTIEIPVRYGGADGPDLDEVARFAGCSAREVVKRHAEPRYRVYMLGFVPGFAYLGRVPAGIAAPRRRVPRERVPAGSVGIAGEQTGVYPIETPGGWQLIGRTPLAMFDAGREPASLLAPGDLVRFIPL
jgi:KipI family sensor histidine kinase inhibitor